MPTVSVALPSVQVELTPQSEEQQLQRPPEEQQLQQPLADESPPLPPPPPPPPQQPAPAAPPRNNSWAWVRSRSIAALADAFDKVGLAEPAGPMLDWLSGGAIAVVPGADRFSEADSQCIVCFDAPATFATSTCDHGMCTSCAVAYVRTALGDATAQVHAAGVRCPMHGSGCGGHVTSVEAARLLTARESKQLAALAVQGVPLPTRQPSPAQRTPQWVQSLRAVATRALQSRFGPADQLSEMALSLREVQRLERFMLEVAVPANLRTWCPRCKLLLVLPEEKVPGAGAARKRRSSRLRRSFEWLSSRCQPLWLRLIASG